MLLENTHCLVCDCPLGDLRIGQACPTCGYRVGLRKQTVHQANTSTTTMLIIGIGLFLVAVSGKPVGRWEPLQLMMLSACVLLTWRVIAGRKRKAVLWDRGFVLMDREGSPKCFLWKDVRRVRTNAQYAEIDFLSEDGHRFDSVEIAFFGSHRRAEEFVASAAKWLRRYEKDGRQDHGQRE